jgi:UDP-N-acetylmuramoyl-tripeptide--D-alanyl-D-alanine ligase
MATPIPANDAVFSLSEIAEATGAQVRAGDVTQIRGIATDSRGDVHGKLFVALEGERFDGHEFVDAAIAGGAVAICISRDLAVNGAVSVVRVNSTWEALGALAHRHRRRWAGTLIAVAGSAGKTTTKSAIASVLAAVLPGQVHSVAGNLNNLVGVPMVLFGLTDAHRLAVVEIGTNQPGEVAKLAWISAPDVAVLTLVALEHSALLGDLDKIESEEGALLRALAVEGIAVGNVDDERVRRQLELSRAQRKIGYGTHPLATYRLIEQRALGARGAELFVERPSVGERRSVRFESALLGEPGALSSVCALAVCEAVIGRSLGSAEISAGLASQSVREAGRLCPIELADRSLLVDDSYNANPASVRGALSTARKLCAEHARRLVVVLGEMRELGDDSAREHALLGEEILRSGAAVVIGVAGDAALFIAPLRERGVDALFVNDSEQALPRLLERLQPGDVILVKGSRGVSVELIVEGVRKAKGRVA